LFSKRIRPHTIAWSSAIAPKSIKSCSIFSQTRSKFTESTGTVTVRCKESGNTASIEVVDTGVGIPPNKLEAIFEPFVQLGRSLSSAHEGTGLGLAISRELARAMKGNLSVSSKRGSGSTFYAHPAPDTIAASEVSTLVERYRSGNDPAHVKVAKLGVLGAHLVEAHVGHELLELQRILSEKSDPPFPRIETDRARDYLLHLTAYRRPVRSVRLH